MPKASSVNAIYQWHAYTSLLPLFVSGQKFVYKGHNIFVDQLDLSMDFNFETLDDLASEVKQSALVYETAYLRDCRIDRVKIDRI